MENVMADLSGKRALVTGAARGIGAAIARALAAHGADVAITYEKSADAAAVVVKAIEATGRKGVAIQADSADAAAVKRSVEEAVSALGGLDILVNNAGVARLGPVAEMSLADIDAILDVNVRGVVLASQAAIPHLGEGGRIITTGSNVATRVPFPGLAVYAMSKSALLSFTQGLARELGPKGITVNLVHPGPTDTDMNPASGPMADTMKATMAIPHYGKPEDVAAAIVFLASPGARHITGTGILVDGGANA
jgi:NAD(P)-dependent dehydrogenase (short-subunit alcohol dehydrogenase family)